MPVIPLLDELYLTDISVPLSLYAQLALGFIAEPIFALSGVVRIR
jgi:hypothetical protein